MRFLQHIDFFEFGQVLHSKLTKNPKKIFKKNFFFQMSNVSTCVVRHKLKLHEIKSPDVRNTLHYRIVERYGINIQGGRSLQF